MPSFYLDTSALVKLYVREEGTDRVLELAQDPERNTLVTLDITLLEFRSAIRRREREGDIPALDANRIIRQMTEDASSRYLIQPATSMVMEEAIRLLDLYPLRAFDALQLAGCLVVRNRVPGPLTFVCADRRLGEAAAHEGLMTLVPAE